MKQLALGAALLCASGLGLVGGCSKEPKPLPPVIIDARDRPAAPVAQAPAAPVAQAPAAPQGAAAPAVPAAPQPHPTVCEVEIMGEVTLPKGAKQKGVRAVYVSDGDCLAEGAHILGRMQVNDTNRYFIEVFAKWGSDVSICAGLEPAEGKPARLYAKAEGKFHVAAPGEVMFNNVNMVLQPGAPHLFPKAGPVK